MVDIDIVKYFDLIPHSHLRAFLDRQVTDGVEDKVAQRAIVMVLEAVYEQDFLPCSYGFRPGRSLMHYCTAT